MSRALTFLCVITVALSLPAEWTDLYPNWESNPALMMGLGCVSPNQCYSFGMLQSGVPDLTVLAFNGQPEDPFQQLLYPSPMIQIQAVAAGGTDNATYGVCTGMGFGNGAQYFNKTAITPAYVPGGGEWMDGLDSQDARVSADGKYSMIIPMGIENRILFGDSYGKSYTWSNITSPVPVPGCTAPRYGSIADNQTWYVTLGAYPIHEEHRRMAGPNEVIHWKTTRIGVAHNTVTGQRRIVRRPPSRVPHKFSDAAVGKNGDNCTYSGAIVKTSDGGKTWKTLVSNTSYYYFNQIDCINATRCVAVAECDEVDNGPHPGAYVFLTTDGETFKLVKYFKSGKNSGGYEYSLMSVEWANETEVWVAGAMSVEIMGQALFLRSSDAGETWEEMPLDTGYAEIMDLSFPYTANPTDPRGAKKTGVGYALALTDMAASTVLKRVPHH